MQDRDLDWLRMRKRVSRFLRNHLSTEAKYREHKRALRMLEADIVDLKRQERAKELSEEELREAPEDLAVFRDWQDEVMGELDELIPLVFPDQEDVLVEWQEARRMRAA
jgi:hypothetical protein